MKGEQKSLWHFVVKTEIINYLGSHTPSSYHGASLECCGGGQHPDRNQFLASVTHENMLTEQRQATVVAVK